MDRWYTLLVSLCLAAALVLFAFWVQGRQVAVRVAPIQTQLEEHVTVIAEILEGDRIGDDARLTALEARVRELEARPVERVVIREFDRPVPVFARGKAIGR